jgi:hypothetical protein
MPNLTQLGNQRIEIIVKKESGSFSQTNAKEKETDNIGGENEEYSFWLGTANRNRKKRVIKTNATHALAIAKQVTDLGLEYWISGIGNKYGDQSYQEQVSRQFEIVKDVGGFASSTAMGAVYGAWGGPIGAILGAVFGAMSSATSIAVKYSSREREFNYKMFKENNAIEYQRARASINMTTGRLR